jgi:hypothetical protein
MWRKVFGGVLVLVFCASLGLADEIRAVILKVDGDKVTFAENKGKGEKGPEQTLPVAANVKVVKGKYNQENKKIEAGDALEGGLKNEVFTKIGEKGLRGVVITDADNKTITEIRVGGRGKRKQ